jgi:hypothetical protein
MKQASHYYRSLCLDCGVDTSSKNGIGEYYVVTDELWACANPGDVGMLCIGCLERRLGHELTPDDFKSCPVNSDHRGFPKSGRLLQRLGSNAWPLHRKPLRKFASPRKRRPSSRPGERAMDQLVLEFAAVAAG